MGYKQTIFQSNETEVKQMRKELLVMVCALSLILGAVSMANATVVNWTLLKSTAVASHGPGPDDLLGTTDDNTTGTQHNNCNFNYVADCDTTGTPTQGSYSVVALELPQTASCLAGALGDPCTTNTDCAPGGFPDGICLPCPDVAGWDTYSYMGNVGKPLGNGKMTACQETGLFRWTAINLGSTESISSGTGATCINLRTSPSSFSSGCGPGASFTSLANIKFSLGCNPLLGAGQINNLNLGGRVYATDTAIAAVDCQCYPKTSAGATALNAIRTIAANAPNNGSHLLVLCGNTAIPNDSTTTSVCLRGATVWDVVVAYTGANASSCTDADPLCTPSSCAGGVAEAAQ
jgi:hypothetical protein